jgi:hypothetical protein
MVFNEACLRRNLRTADVRAPIGYTVKIRIVRYHNRPLRLSYWLQADLNAEMLKLEPPSGTKL